MAENETQRERHLRDRDEYVGVSGLTEAEASEFHGYFTRSFLGFLALAVAAHFLTWLWAPWGTPPM